jgi:regulatory protein
MTGSAGGAARRDARDKDGPGDSREALHLRERALRLLARREHSRSELARKLKGFAESTEAVTALLDDLERGGLLSDARYAEQRAGSRAGRLGNARLAHELRTKGVDEAIIDAALDSAGVETDRARAVWQKKFGALPASREEWARQARFLQSRGFSTDTIRRILDDRDHDDERSSD